MFELYDIKVFTSDKGIRGRPAGRRDLIVPIVSQLAVLVIVLASCALVNGTFLMTQISCTIQFCNQPLYGLFEL